MSGILANKLSKFITCRKCNVLAELFLVEGTRHKVECPECGTMVEGNRATDMLDQEFRYAAVETKKDSIEILARKPNFQFLENIQQNFQPPDWEFFVDLDRYRQSPAG